MFATELQNNLITFAPGNIKQYVIRIWHTNINKNVVIQDIMNMNMSTIMNINMSMGTNTIMSTACTVSWRSLLLRQCC